MAATRGEMKFYADAMLGRLATWMRILGFDVAYTRDIDDRELVVRSLVEGRIVLTRDKLLAKRRSVRGRCLIIKSDHVREQLRQVVDAFGLRAEGLLGRCVRCNVPLVGVSKETIKDEVPLYVFETQKRFKRCPGCRRVYWAGTHSVHIKKELSRIMEGEGRAEGGDDIKE